MGRNEGTYKFSSNFELTARSPLDAKSLVATRADLLSTATWTPSTLPGTEWTYVGMIVTVWNDGTNNGVYRLTTVDYTNIANWDKLGASGDVTSLSTALSTETSTRTSSDTSLTTRISSEESTRGSVDTSLQTRVSNEESNRASAISSEASTRSAVDSSLQTRISSEESNRTSAISSEASTRAAAISSEASTRAAADGTFLVKSSNLSDLTIPSSARSNIGLGSVDNTADSAKNVNYANTAGSAGTAGSASNVDWGNVSAKPTWASTNIYDAGIGTYLSQPVWMVDIARFGNFGDTTNRQFTIWGSLVMNPYYTDGDATIDPRAGWGTTTSSMIVVKFHAAGGAYTQGFYLPGAADPSQGTPAIGTTVHFVNNGWNHYTVIGKRSDYPGPCGYNMSWAGTYNVSYFTFEDFRTGTFVFGGTFWLLTNYM